MLSTTPLEPSSPCCGGTIPYYFKVSIVTILYSQYSGAASQQECPNNHADNVLLYKLVAIKVYSYY